MTTTSRHGLQLEAVTVQGQPLLKCTAIGHLTHSDYEAFIPRMEALLEQHSGEENRLLFDTTELQGWDLRAALDDISFGLTHRKGIGKVAVLSSSRLLELSCRVANSLHLYGRELRSFENREEALAWLAA